MLALDTGILIEIEKGNKKLISAIISIKEKHPQNLAITSHVYAEFYFGILNYKKEKKDNIMKRINAFEIIDFNKESAKIFAELKQYMESKGKPLPIFDLLIASGIIQKKATLLTRDKHFKDIPGLNAVFL